MMDVELAWVAGFLEGEGCFAWNIGSTQHVRVSQRQREPLLRLQKYVGAGRIVRKKPTTNRAGISSKAGWRWTIHGENARRLMKQVYPLMSPWRKKQIRGTN